MFLGYVIPKDAPLIVKLPFCYFFQWLYISLLVLNIINAVSVFLGYGIFVVPFILKEFWMDHPAYKSISMLRTPKILTLAYRTAQIMHGKGILIVGFFLLPTHTIIYKIIIFTSYDT